MLGVTVPFSTDGARCVFGTFVERRGAEVNVAVGWVSLAGIRARVRPSVGCDRSSPRVSHAGARA